MATDGNVVHALSGWLTKATDTHAEYVILISFALQQWLRERASVLRLYVRFLSCYNWLHFRFTLIPLPFVTFRRIVMLSSSGSNKILMFRRIVVPSSSRSSKVLTFRRIVIPSSSGSSKILTFRPTVVPYLQVQAKFWRFGGSWCLHPQGQAKFWRFGGSWCLHFQGQAKFWRFGGSWCLHLQGHVKYWRFGGSCCFYRQGQARFNVSVNRGAFIFGVKQRLVVSEDREFFRVKVLTFTRPALLLSSA